MAWNTTVTPPADIKTLSSFTLWFNTDPGGAAAIRTQWGQKFDPMEAAIGEKRKAYAGWQESWKPIQWAGSPWESRYNEQQAGMDVLSKRIAAGTTAEDTQAAQDYAANLYGMTPDAWQTLLNNWTDRLQNPEGAAAADALAASKYMETISGTPFAQEQAKADRVMLAQMQEQMGKQLESIFGERGGMGGFQAAYELTAQLNNTFLTAKTQEHLSMFNQAVTSVNANNGYYKDLISQGAISASDYLQFRFSQLQQGFQNYVTAMQETRSQFDQKVQLNEMERKRVDDNFASQIDQMEKQMAMEMGGYANIQEYIDALYAQWGQGWVDIEATGATFDRLNASLDAGLKGNEWLWLVVPGPILIAKFCFWIGSWFD